MRLLWNPNAFGSTKCFYGSNCGMSYFISFSTELTVRVYREHNLSLLAKPYVAQTVDDNRNIGIHFFNVVLSGLLL